MDILTYHIIYIYLYIQSTQCFYISNLYAESIRLSLIKDSTQWEPLRHPRPLLLRKSPKNECSWASACHSRPLNVRMNCCGVWGEVSSNYWSELKLDFSGFPLHIFGFHSWSWFFIMFILHLKTQRAQFEVTKVIPPLYLTICLRTGPGVIKKNHDDHGASVAGRKTQSPHPRILQYEPGSKLVVLGMAIPPLIGNPYNGYITPTIGLMTIPYYMEIMGV